MKWNTEDMLQDYLDGRLGDEVRAEFEALMASDPELAERVESYRGLGRALREGDPELSPGFYTRTRARFEESRRGRVRMPRLLSWEAAGLATAAVLVGVLFIPYLIDRNRQGELLPLDIATWEPPPVERVVEDVDDAMAREGEKIEHQAAPAPAAEGLDDAPALKEEMREPEFAPAPTAEIPDDAMAHEGEKMEEKTAPAEQRREKGDKKRARAASLGRMETPLWEPEISSLPSGAVEPGAVVVEELDPDRRRVLIGTREWPFRCEEITVAMTTQSYRITLRPTSDPSLAAEWGCAVIVDRDHRAIEVLPPPEERP